MISSTVSFNLLRQAWIPVVNLDGVAEELSILDLLYNADQYGEIAHEDPLVVIAAYRFVLAFLHRALDGPKETGETVAWFKDGFPEEKIEDYAKKWEHRFNLFDEKYPFGQHPHLPRDKWVDHWSRLMAARGSFNTNFLYSYELRDKADNTDATTPQEAVLQMLAHQHFALGGLTKRFVTSAKSSPFATACLTLVLGNNLRETLCLNLIPYDDRHNKEEPHWEAEPPDVKALERGAVKPVQGLAESYTWVARSIRFKPDEAGRVTQMIYAEGLNPGDSNYDDPMICLTLNRKGELYPLGYRVDRGLWRDLHSFVPEKDSNTAPTVIDEAADVLDRAGQDFQQLEFASFGIVNNKAKISMVRHETLRLPPLALTAPDLRTTLQAWTHQAQEEAYLLNSALKVVAAGLLSKRRNGAAPREISNQVASFQADSLFWPHAETRFWAHIDSLPHDTHEYWQRSDEINRKWSDELRRLKIHVFKEVAKSLEPTPETLRAINKGYNTLWKGNAKS